MFWFTVRTITTTCAPGCAGIQWCLMVSKCCCIAHVIMITFLLFQLFVSLFAIFLSSFSYFFSSNIFSSYIFFVFRCLEEGKGEKETALYVTVKTFLKAGLNKRTNKNICFPLLPFRHRFSRKVPVFQNSFFSHSFPQSWNYLVDKTIFCPEGYGSVARRPGLQDLQEVLPGQPGPHQTHQHAPSHRCAVQGKAL